jgi:hypothetical protein
MNDSDFPCDLLKMNDDHDLLKVNDLLTMNDQDYP